MDLNPNFDWATPKPSLYFIYFNLLEVSLPLQFGSVPSCLIQIFLGLHFINSPSGVSTREQNSWFWQLKQFVQVLQHQSRPGLTLYSFCISCNETFTFKIVSFCFVSLIISADDQDVFGQYKVF